MAGGDVTRGEGLGGVVTHPSPPQCKRTPSLPCTVDDDSATHTVPSICIPPSGSGGAAFADDDVFMEEMRVEEEMKSHAKSAGGGWGGGGGWRRRRRRVR